MGGIGSAWGFRYIGAFHFIFIFIFCFVACELSIKDGRRKESLNIMINKKG